MSTWFTSDQHYYHHNIIAYSKRPFKDVDHMNEVLINNHNLLVKPEDTVFHLGDFSLSKKAIHTVLPKLNGTHHLVAGNHDHCHPLHAKKPEKIERMTKEYLDAGFKSVQLEDCITFGLEVVKMHHMPYNSDHTADVRYLSSRPKNEGHWLLHGHVHDAWKIRDRMINVGVDAMNYFPVSYTTIAELIRLETERVRLDGGE